MRVKRGVKARRRRNKVLKLAKGFRGRSKNTIRTATHRVEKSLCYAYRDRKQKKRHFRELWIIRLSAAVRELGMSYSQFMSGLKKAGVELNRKVLADLAVTDPKSFASVVDIAKAQV